MTISKGHFNNFEDKGQFMEGTSEPVKLLYNVLCGSGGAM